MKEYVKTNIVNFKKKMKIFRIKVSNLDFPYIYNNCFANNSMGNLVRYILKPVPCHSAQYS